MAAKARTAKQLIGNANWGKTTKDTERRRIEREEEEKIEFPIGYRVIVFGFTFLVQWIVCSHLPLCVFATTKSLELDSLGMFLMPLNYSHKSNMNTDVWQQHSDLPWKCHVATASSSREQHGSEHKITFDSRIITKSWKVHNIYRIYY